MDKFKFPDTGQVNCYDRQGHVCFPAATDSLSGENGFHLRHPMVFVKLDAEGRELPEAATPQTGHCLTKDLNTGLIWEVKSLDPEAPNYAGLSYTWEEAQSLYVARLNDLHWGGRNDWRIPNKDELRSIMDYGRTEPAVDTTYFPNLGSDLYWTSLTYQMQPVFGWCIFSGLGSATAISKASRRKVVAVCGGYEPLFGVMSDERFTDNGDGTVTDKVTGLMWQQGDNERMTFFEALEACKQMTLGGYTDWRLPNIKELNTILNLNRDGGWWYFRKFFPTDGLTPPLLHYLSGTSYEGNYAWVTNFNYGYDGYYASKQTPLLFRAVRSIKESEEGTFRLSESGQDACYNIAGQEISRPARGEKLFGQDGCFKIHPFRFAKESLADSDVVRDENTGLMWEIKSDKADAFNNRDRLFTLQEAQAYIAELNRSSYNGFTDWRLPNLQELRSIVNYTDRIPAIDTALFPDTAPAFYWSSQPYMPDSSLYWGIYFGYGCAICYNRDTRFRVRAVRGGFAPKFGLCEKVQWRDNGDGTVTDLLTGLMWKQDESGQLGLEDALRYCDELRLGGYDDWRMPNIRELATLIDLNYTDGVWFHKNLFPGTITKPLGFYWSSSTYASTFGWGVNFQFGYDGYYADKINGEYPFRPVRNAW